MSMATKAPDASAQAAHMLPPADEIRAVILKLDAQADAMRKLLRARMAYDRELAEAERLTGVAYAGR